jgi:YD repeat-containing protein
MTDGTGTTTNNWDSLGRLTSSTNGAGATVGYGYDLAGRITSITYPGTTGIVKRGYDEAGHLTDVTDWAGHTTTL